MGQIPMPGLPAGLYHAEESLLSLGPAALCWLRSSRLASAQERWGAGVGGSRDSSCVRVPSSGFATHCFWSHSLAF